MSIHFKRNTVRTLCVLALSAGAGCSPFGEEAGNQAVQVTVSMVPDGYGMTRSSYNWEEDEIRDIQVVVTTEDGDVHAVLYSDTPSNLHFTAGAGRLYKLWAAANLGGKVEVRRLKDFTESLHNITSAGIARSGVPMFSEGSCDILVTGGENHAVIPLSRMMARVDFRLDKSGLSYPGGFSVSSVRICSPVDAYTPFAGDVKRGYNGTPDYIYDSASDQDLSRLNAGGTARLYTFENMQGTLLPGNTDPWKKIPTYIGVAGPYCTYLEVTCSYSTPYDHCSDITYRMYLGEDATTNFDVRRNTVYRLTLMPTEREVRGRRGSWKIEPGTWEDDEEDPVYSSEFEYELTVSPESATIAEGEEASFTATFVVSEYTTVDGIRTGDAPDVTETDVTSYASWDVTGGDIYVENCGEGVFSWASGPGTAEISAAYGGCKVTASVTTLAHDVIYTEEYEYDLEVSPVSVTIGEGESASFSATMITSTFILADGERTSDVPSSVSETDITHDAAWSVDSGSRYVSSEGAGVFSWAGGPGSAEISAAYGGCTGTASVTTLAHDVIYTEEYEYDLEVSPVSVTIGEGESASFSATLITSTFILADGERTSDVPSSVSETDVTDEAVWSVDSGSRYVSSEGAGVFSWAGGPGSAVIRATYGNMFDTASIITEEHIPDTGYRYDYSISPEEAEITVGETVGYAVTMYTYTIIDGVEQPGHTSETLPGSQLSWSSSDNSVSSVSDGIATGLDNGTVVITATAGDGVSLSSTLEVRHVFEFTDGPDEILPGESFGLSFTTTLDTGDIDIDCSDSAFSIEDISGSHVTIHCDSDATPGSTVTVTGGNGSKGATDSWSITVGTPLPPDPVVTYSLAVSVKGSSMAPVGETISLSALLTVYHDGEYHETRDVTDDCVWGCEYTDVSVSSGTVSSSSNGFFDIIATYSIDGNDYQDSCGVTFTAREYITITIDYDSDMSQFWASASADCAVPLPVFISATFYTWTGGYVGDMSFYIQQDDCDSQYNYASIGAEGAPARYVINFAEFSNGSSEFYDEEAALYWCLSY